MKQPEYIIRHISSHRHIYKLQENGRYKLWGATTPKKSFELIQMSKNDYSYDALQMSGEWSNLVEKVELIDTHENLFVELL